MDENLKKISFEIGQQLKEKNLTIAAAESCTGGLLSHVLTAISGASQYFVGGIIAYSNPIKEAFLGVKADTLIQHGAVSQQTAGEMANGIRTRFSADIGLSTTGIAGPTGGTLEKPVGLVWMGISSKSISQTFDAHFPGDRENVQYSTVSKILTVLLEELKNIE